MKVLRGLAVAVGAASLAVILHAQISLAPVSPADVASPSHEMHQDDAIQSLALEITTTQADLMRRIDRLEHLMDGVFMALIALGIGHFYAAKKTNDTHTMVRDHSDRWEREQ